MFQISSYDNQALDPLEAEVVNQTTQYGFSANFGEALWCIEG